MAIAPPNIFRSLSFIFSTPKTPKISSKSFNFPIDFIPSRFLCPSDCIYRDEADVISDAYCHNVRPFGAVISKCRCKRYRLVKRFEIRKSDASKGGVLDKTFTELSALTTALASVEEMCPGLKKIQAITDSEQTYLFLNGILPLKSADKAHYNVERLYYEKLMVDKRGGLSCSWKRRLFTWEANFVAKNDVDEFWDLMELISTMSSRPLVRSNRKKFNAGRKVSHAGHLYTKDATKLAQEIEGWLDEVNVVKSSHVRGVIAPHVDYKYSGLVAASAFGSIDPSKIKRIFLMGPSHHYYTPNCALSNATAYKTPLGDLPIDLDIIDELKATGRFEMMYFRVDDAEHSLEMHLPFLAKIFERHQVKVVPILVGELNAENEALYGQILAKYVDDPENFFSVSSNFGHSGSRFNYLSYDQNNGIEALDRMAMDVIETGDPEAFKQYLLDFNNTFSGRNPIILFLHMLRNCSRKIKIRFLRYGQSSPCKSIVSFASAVAVEEVDDIIRCGSKELFTDETKEAMARQIHYDDAAIDRLLDHERVGDEENTLDDVDDNGFLKAFKVANFEYEKEVEAAAGEEALSAEAKSNTNTSERTTYWEDVLKDKYEVHKVEEFNSLGKGKISLKQMVLVDDDDLAGLEDFGCDGEDDNYETELSDNETLSTAASSGRRPRKRAQVTESIPLMEGEGKSFRFGAGEYDWVEFLPRLKQKTDEEIEKLFGFNSGKLRMDERIDLSMSDLDLVPLLIQENYVNYRPSSLGKDDSGEKRMSSLARAAESIADGDIINVQIRRYRQWQLSQSSCVSSCIIPASLMHGQREIFAQGERNFNRFGGWLGKNSTLGKNRRILEDLHVHMLAASGSYVGRGSLRLDFLTLLSKQLSEPLRALPKEEAVKKVVEFMDSYSLSMEDYDTVMELSKFKERRSPTDGILPAVKAGLTKAYKDGSKSRVIRTADLITLPGFKKAPKKKGGPTLEPVDEVIEGNSDVEAVEEEEDGEDAEESEDAGDKADKLNLDLESYHAKGIQVQVDLKGAGSSGAKKTQKASAGRGKGGSAEPTSAKRGSRGSVGAAK